MSRVTYVALENGARLRKRPSGGASLTAPNSAPDPKRRVAITFAHMTTLHGRDTATAPVRLPGVATTRGCKGPDDVWRHSLPGPLFGAPAEGRVRPAEKSFGQARTACELLVGQLERAGIEKCQRDR
jgi:hypothetical protein